MTASVPPFLAARQADEEPPAIEAQTRRVADFVGPARQSLALHRIRFSPVPKLSKITFAGLPPGIASPRGAWRSEFESATEPLETPFPCCQRSRTTLTR
jgi:hypothetical protein